VSELLDLIKERFPEFTPIQKNAIPKILQGGNVLVISQTGSGKTEAALLPVLEKINKNEKGIQALYITPLRSLNRDLKERFNWWCERLGITHAIRHGDTTQSERDSHRKNPPQIMLITIESIQAVLIGRVMRNYLKNIKFVIIDEIHDVMDNKRGAQLSIALERLNEIAQFQRVALSATVSNEQDAAGIAFGDRPYSIAKEEKKKEMDLSVELIEDQKKRVNRVKELAQKERTIIFVNTRSTAEELGATLKEDGFLDVHHGSLSRESRIEAEDKFKKGEMNAIIATSSLELGIDVGDVGQVIQYCSPRTVSRIVQRAGRSGHTLSGIPRAIIIAPDFDDYLEGEAIISFANEGWLERKEAERGTLDVIAHQLVGIAIERGGILLKDVHKIFQKAYSYSIPLSKLKLIALQLDAERMIFFDEIEDDYRVRITRKGREYYYSNLSTIPKQKRFIVKEILNNRIISNLDEKFVSGLEIGTCFLSKGQAWRVVELENEQILVERGAESDILIPAWVGEDIPVPFEIAQSVGKLRKSSKNEEANEKTILVESTGEIIILNCCFGTKVNEGLGRMIAYSLSEKIGESVQMVSDPYRIILRAPYEIKKEYAIENLKKIGDVRAQLERSLAYSHLMKLKFLHVGRLFGLLEEGATIGHRFIEALKNSVVYEETIREIFFRYFDVERTQGIIDEIRSGKIRIISKEGKEISYFGKLGLEKFSGREYFGAFEPKEKIIEAFRNNANNKMLEMVCVNCGTERYVYLGGFSEGLICGKCGGASLSLKLKRKTEMEHAAALIRNYGKKALIALSTYGIGPETAERILRKLHRKEEDFYLDIIEAQKNFVKNKKYWKVG